ncbi:universal stress protein [Sinomicrobium kalidii]|uniref:universal stress protein n=1 Tax=Sinomicrobium kalidii TaxID=2900738 RepID=UPI001E2F07E5|nr:universal stress protein [Sinomicrobium kalidii]UGU14683.1 universal stress protein [Sinomicrobium kalidii]
MKRILLPTDFSENAHRAMQYATDLYKHEVCTFYVLHMVSVSYPAMSVMAPQMENPAFEAALTTGKKALEKSIHQLESLKNPKHLFKSLLRTGFPVDGINHIVERDAIDMIVMGTKGTGNARGISYGSNAVIVMEKVTGCPVIAVPGEAHFGGLKEVVFPTSYEFACKSGEIKPFKDFIKDFGSTVRILHVSEKEELTAQQKGNKRLLEDELTGVSYTFHSMLNIDPAVGISCFSESREVDLIAVVSRKHNFFYRLMEKPVLKGISYYSKIPVMVMHH